MKHKHYDLIVAWANGAEIEARIKSGYSWTPVKNPTWGNSLEYRIKPEPKPDIIYEDFRIFVKGDMFSSLYNVNPDYQKVKWIIDGETGKIKSVELIDK